jgi:hypothetical protein
MEELMMGAFKELLIEATDWVEELKQVAEKDEQISYAIFRYSENAPFLIAAGWSEGFNESCSDIMYISKTNPTYAMCIKIVINDGPWLYADFDILNMPYDEVSGEVDDTCIALEREDSSEAVALFYLNELERINKEWGDKFKRK